MQIENTLIGSIILNDERLTEVKPILKPEDFQNDLNRKIYEIMLKMHESKLKIDEETLRERIKTAIPAMQSLEIKELIMNYMIITGCSANALYYAKLVVEKSINNQIGHVFNETVDMINEGKIEEINLEKVKDKIEALKNQGVTELTRGIKEILSDSDDSDGVLIPLGYSKLDSAHSGGLIGEFSVLAGSPSTGKSQFALNLMLKATKNNVPARCLFVCQEMGDKEIQDRITGLMTGIDFNFIKKIRRGKATSEIINKYSEKYENAIKRLSELPIKIHATGVLTVSELEAVVMANIKSSDIIFIDYLQQIKKENFKQTDYEKINQVSSFCMEQSVKNKVPIIGLSQFNRDGYKDESKRPTMAHLRESGQLEQDAANIWLLWRDKKDKGPEIELELQIAKNRNGQTGLILFDYTMNTGYIREKFIQ